MAQVPMVTKKNGKKEAFDITKIRKHIESACKGTKINPLELESMILLDLSHKLTSTDIQDTLILTAKNNVSDEHPDWDIVAGRLMAESTISEVWKNTKFDINDYHSHIKYLIKNGYYRDDIQSMLSEDLLNSLGNYIKKDRDYNLRLSQIALLKSKYLIRNKKGVLEYISTSDMTNSVILASIEAEDRKEDIIKEYYDMLSEYIISLATPFKANLRIPNGNTGSCFIGEMPDNTGGIFKSYSDMARISQEGGGIGWYMSKVRPSNAYSPRVPKANNINKWLKIVNDIAVAVNQRGVRNGAITPALDWWHMDIISFCEIKSELNGDLRDKCFDIFPQIIVDDYFVDAVLEDKTIYLFDQYEYKKLTGVDITELIGDDLYKAHLNVDELIKKGTLKHFEEVSAKAIWKKALWSWIEYGDFYISHKDNINISNYVTKLGVAKCVNLCCESFSLSKETTEWEAIGRDGKEITLKSDGLTHSCSLISINVANILNDDALLQRACKNAVRMLDASIDLGTMPVFEAKTSAELIRNIGVGLVGVADYMAWNKALYDTEEGRLLAETLAEKVAYYCYNASIDLAKEKGAYKAFDLANYDKLFGKTPEELNRISPNGFDWIQVQQDILQYGIRNMLILAYAPNTSSGLVQGVTASFLPAHSKNNTQKLSGLIVPVLPKFIDNRYWFYKTKFQYKTEDIILFTRAMQRWVDTGMSMELTINPELNPDISIISNAILDGFKSKELKAVYYSLTIDAKNYVCESCGN